METLKVGQLFSATTEKEIKTVCIFQIGKKNTHFDVKVENIEDGSTKYFRHSSENEAAAEKLAELLGTEPVESGITSRAQWASEITSYENYGAGKEPKQPKEPKAPKEPKEKKERKTRKQKDAAPEMSAEELAAKQDLEIAEALSSLEI